MGIIKKSQNLYRIDAHVFRGGREFRRRELFNGTKAKAEERYLQLKKELREGGNASSLTAAETFGEVLRFYLERNDPGRSKTYFSRLISELGNVPLCFLSDRFDKFIQLLKNSTGKRTAEKIAPGTVNQYIMRSKAALNFAVLHGLIKENPLNRFGKLKETTARRDPSRNRPAKAFKRDRQGSAPFIGDNAVRFTGAL